MPSAPRYFSSNQAIFGTPDLEARIRDGSLHTFGLAEAIIKGGAPDGGLLMPTYIPQIDMDKIVSMKGQPYSDFFFETPKLFFQDVLSEKTLERIGKEAYKFEPWIEDISKNDIIARLDEGPTAAFKDYAAQVFFRVIEALMTEEPQTEIEYRQRLREIELLTFILSTSGDTGSAMGVACHKRQKMWMFILHSSLIGEHISDLQAKQMDILNHNIYVGRALTDFDGCTKITNKLLEDPDLEYMHRNSANSINIGRLLPQITYYFYLYSKLAKKGEKLVVSVPCGNFGDLTAGLFAKKMGLPIDLIVGVNENDVFEKFYRTGIYKPLPKAIPGPSNSMVVNTPSNTRRVVQLYGGQLIGDNLIVPPNFGELKKDIVAVYSIGNEETHEIVKKYYDEWHMIDRLHSTIEPHGAVAWGTSQKFRRDSGYDGKIITFETAHPGKFPESLQRDGITPELPKCLARLVGKPHGKFYPVENYSQAKDLLVDLYNQQVNNHPS